MTSTLLPEPTRPAPRPAPRAVWGPLVVAAAIGLAAALIATMMALQPGVTLDLAYYWRGAQLLLHGQNPYTVPINSSVWALPDPLFYPLPALLLTVPIAWLPLPLAAALFAGIPVGLLAWQRARTDELWRLIVLAHPGVVMAIVLGQWSPWLMVAMAWPAVGFLLLAKPTLGAACWIARPTREAAIAAVVLLGVSLLVTPRWPLHWLANLSAVVKHPAPLVTLLGSVVVLAAFRWRDPDARLVLAMACVPQLLFFADQAPLITVARTTRESLWLVAMGWVAWLLWHVRLSGMGAAYVLGAAPYALLGCYWPAVALVLWRARTVHAVEAARA